jgi:hypothetical protein
MTLSNVAPARRIFIILSARALTALKSLLTNALESLSLHLITDSSSDRELLIEEAARYPFGGRHRCKVFATADLGDQESRMFGRYPNLQLVRDGRHCCLRRFGYYSLFPSGALR